MPALFLTGDLDDRTPLETMVRPMFDTLTVAPRYFGIIADGGHLSFMGLCNYLPNYPGCTSEYRDPDQVYPLTCELTAAFLDAVAGQTGAGPYLSPDIPWLDWEAVD